MCLRRDMRALTIRCMLSQTMSVISRPGVELPVERAEGFGDATR